MENESPSLPPKRSYTWAWILAAVFFLCAVLLCCLLILGGAIYFFQVRSTAVSTVIVPSMATVPVPRALATPVPTLDLNAGPLFGSDSLQRAFTPDPHVVQITAGGEAGTQPHECGLASSAPSYAFQLSGGASETFLRLFFVPDQGAPTALLVHTPKGDWLCVPGSSSKPPVVDLEFAPSGRYLVWVATLDSGVTIPGRLSITQDRDVGP